MRVTAAGTGVDGIEVLLITSSGGKGLVFPKVSCVINEGFSVDITVGVEVQVSQLAQVGDGEATG